jgi:hypothetical protein
VSVDFDRLIVPRARPWRNMILPVLLVRRRTFHRCVSSLLTRNQCQDRRQKIVNKLLNARPFCVANNVLSLVKQKRVDLIVFAVALAVNTSTVDKRSS